MLVRRFFIAIFVGILILVAGDTWAQSTNATISGRVEDQTGAAIPLAQIVAVNVGTNVKYFTETNGVGLYAVNVPPGKYRILVSKQGFAQIVKPDVELHVQDDAGINFAMRVGSATESVTIEGGAPLVNTQSGTVGTVVDQDFVSKIPLNGRSLQSLILLAPGVVATPTGNGSYDDGQFSVNGQRASTNYFTVDGVSANFGIGTQVNFGTVSPVTAALGGAYPGFSAVGSTNSLVSVDALQEFRIQTSTFAAEYGRQPGGQVSLVTRSGTNKFHGSIFEYFRNDALDARDYFDHTCTTTGCVPRAKSPLRQNQFGGTFSGPIYKDKTFFFFSYEGLRLRLPQHSGSNTTVPSLRLRSIAAPALQPLLNAFPRPTGPELLNAAGLPQGAAPFDGGWSNPSTLDASSIRIDHTVNAKLTLFGRFNESPSDTTSLLPSYGIRRETSTRTITLGATSAFSARLQNELRVNYSRQIARRQYVPSTLGGAVPADPDLLTNGRSDYGYFSLSYLPGTPTLYAGTVAANYQRQINVVDNLSWIVGVHKLKFGVDHRHLTPTYGPGGYESGLFFSEASVVNGIAASALVWNYDSSRPRFHNFSVYGQDTWSVSPTLTFDIGLRWEFNPAPTEADGKMPPVALGISGDPPNVSNATLAPAGTPFYKTFYTAFAPRFGVAYQLHQTKGWETVLRGGIGIYYDLGTSAATSGLQLVSVKSLSGVSYPLSDANATPRPIVIPTSLPITDVNVFSNDPDLKLPYTVQWNVALEQALGNRQAFSLSYVASTAQRLLATQALNAPANYYAGARPNPQFLGITYTRNGPTADYQSFQLQYKTHLNRGLQALANYTWSHAIDQVSTDLWQYVLLRGNADFDVRHNFSAALTYDVPQLRSAGFLSHVTRGWTTDAIVHAQSGLPVDPYTVGTIDVSTGVARYTKPDIVPGQPFYISDPTVPGGRRFNAAAFQMPPTQRIYPYPSIPSIYYDVPIRQGDAGRNILRGLPRWQLDWAMGRDFTLTEALKLQFKGELFNIFNHPQFGPPSGDFTVPATFGVTASTFGRQLSGLSSIYQMGGPRSVQLSLRLLF